MLRQRLTQLKEDVLGKRSVALVEAQPDAGIEIVVAAVTDRLFGHKNLQLLVAHGAHVLQRQYLFDSCSRPF